MKKHSTKNSKRIYQFTLSAEGEKILEDFATKYGTTKSFVIDRALRFLAAQYHKKIIISYELLSDTTTTAAESISIYKKQEGKNLHLNDEAYEIAKTPWIDE